MFRLESFNHNLQWRKRATIKRYFNFEKLPRW